MSTTPRTDAALLSSDCAYNCRHTFKLLIEEKYDQGKCVFTGPDIANGNDGVVVLADFARELETELARLRDELKELSQAYELNRVSIDELDADRARAERAEAALAFIAANGGTAHETECGPIACNGSWCAQQARAAIDAAMKP